jgi:hypothetical protein
LKTQLPLVLSSSASHSTRHRLFIFSSIVSFSLSVAILILWLRGYFRRDVFTLQIGEARLVWVESVRGGIQMVVASNESVDNFQLGWSAQQPSDSMLTKMRFGFGIHSGDLYSWYDQSFHKVHLFVTTVPNYAILSLTALLPVWWSALRIRRYLRFRK